MASASILHSEEQFLCSICLEVFTDPVTTPCGHNYCKTCITHHWDTPYACRCPLCNKTFYRRPDISVNYVLSEMADQFRKSNQLKQASSTNQEPWELFNQGLSVPWELSRQEPSKRWEFSCSKPWESSCKEPSTTPWELSDEIFCDICTGIKVKALKSCLVCQISYCDTHLEPHQRVTALKRHKLVRPVKNPEDYLCKSDHKSHHIVSTKEVYEGKKAELGKTKVEVQQMIQKRQTSFSPSVNTEHTTNEYRFRFFGAGLFQCNVTGLVFGLTGEGEVLYRTVQWDERWLQSTGGTPAGPLFDIRCPQESICQLHLPHCDTTPGDDMAVAHITKEGVNLLEPQNVSKTHVIVNVTHLSLFGLLWRIYDYFKETSGEVVLFRQPQSHPRRKLCVFLLPSNLPLKEVRAKHKDDEYIETTSNCYLTPTKVYRLHCPSYKVQPRQAVKYRLNFGPNFFPTFEVKLDLNAEDVSLTLLGPENNVVWQGDIELKDCRPASASRSNVPTAMTSSQEAEEPVRSRRAEFIRRVSEPVLHSLLDQLLDERFLNDEEMASIRAQSYREEKARSFFDTVKKKGNKARSKMMDALHQLDPNLYEVLTGAD